MTSRRLNDPNYLPSQPTLVEIREALIQAWSITSVFLTRQTDDYSITGNVSHETVICANTIAKTITMVSEPQDDHKVTVVRTDAQVTINGNGKNIEASATLVLSSVGDSRTMIFSSEDDTWWSV
tara:strand:+ start:8292 stop:8663 length:372 start_codon:yes stop_codon:yes gene_type:complete